jgi:uncharacterized protein (DUF58 family)
MPAAATSPFLEMHALLALEHTRFTTRHRIEGSYSGRHKSHQLGGAGEFVDYRDYTPGEDLRRLDWKVLGRTGKAYVRLYQDETNLLCTLAIDASGSMRFGGDGAPGGSKISKLAYAQYLATALSHVISRGQDQVGLAVLGSRLAENIPPGGTPSHIAQVQEAIAAIETRPSLTIAGSLRQLFEATERRGVLLLMSDFLVDDLDQAFAALRLFRHRQWEVIIVHLVDPREEQLPAGGAFHFIGMEDEGTISCSIDDVRASYVQRFEAHAAMVRTLALSNACDYRRVSTAIPYLQTLGGFLVERSG